MNYGEWLYEGDVLDTEKIALCLKTAEDRLDGVEKVGKSISHLIYRAIEGAHLDVDRIAKLGDECLRWVDNIDGSDLLKSRWHGSIAIGLGYLRLLRMDNINAAMICFKDVGTPRAIDHHPQNVLNIMRSLILWAAKLVRDGDYTEALSLIRCLKMDFSKAHRIINIDSTPFTRIGLVGEMRRWLNCLEMSICVDHMATLRTDEDEVVRDKLLSIETQEPFHSALKKLLAKPMKTKLHGGFHWPEDDIKTPDIILAEVKRIPQYLTHIQERGTVIQAGGNVGVYAKALSSHFANVVSIEPHPENWNCLKLNTVDTEHITIHNAALGDGSVSSINIVIPKNEVGNYGAATTQCGSSIPVVKIDEIGAKSVDFILLDIEGDEPLALIGASKTIKLRKPVIALEMKGLAGKHGITDEAIVTMLTEEGYSEVAPIGRDRVFKFIGLTFVCVLKLGGIYDATHVDRLYQQVKSNYGKPFRFICLTDDPSAISSTPLINGWKGWWSKLELFSHDWGRTCYLDLDVSIISDIGWLDQLPDGFHGMLDARGDRLNSSVMVWSGPKPEVLDGFDIAIHGDDKEGDQSWIQSKLNSWGELTIPRVCSFKKSGLAASIVVYHGRPKPWDLDVDN